MKGKKENEPEEEKTDLITIKYKSAKLFETY